MEYQIEGAPLPVVICQLEAGETMLTERGSMSWMTPNMKMETSTNGGLGKAFGRMLSGDSICVYPPTTFSQKVIDTLVDYTGRFARELKVVGPVSYTHLTLPTT